MHKKYMKTARYIRLYSGKASTSNNSIEFKAIEKNYNYH